MATAAWSASLAAAAGHPSLAAGPFLAAPTGSSSLAAAASLDVVAAAPPSLVAAAGHPSLAAGPFMAAPAEPSFLAAATPLDAAATGSPSLAAATGHPSMAAGAALPCRLLAARAPSSLAADFPTYRFDAAEAGSALGSVDTGVLALGTAAGFDSRSLLG
ncbi:hypothetical protein GUJ93_ZPchr0015g6955 [Zizania palustris]|uniref:Uncharacterized protein n=1 Tax=Zizania palustris TaxID=103762 RepID=A0A8J5THD1_ZIZPA|nr:hypothetical protein GUJ93_ZPchr0015g6955 [Zizania palustris]